MYCIESNVWYCNECILLYYYNILNFAKDYICIESDVMYVLYCTEDKVLDFTKGDIFYCNEGKLLGKRICFEQIATNCQK